jgi:hypothetical protein
MKRTFSRLTNAAVALLLGIVAGNMLVGCNADQVQHSAEQVRYAAGGPAPADVAPATQPSAGQAGLDTAHAVVTAASDANPLFGLIAGLVAAGAGVVAGVAGHLNGKSTGVKQAGTAIAEIVDDIGAYNQPSVPWTDATRKILTDLGYTNKVVSPSVAPSTVNIIPAKQT